MPGTTDIAEATVTSTTDDNGRSTVVITAGTTTITLGGNFATVRDTLRDWWTDLPAHANARAEASARIWNTIMAEFRTQLANQMSTLADWEMTVDEVLAEVQTIVLDAAEWENGWFPRNFVAAFDGSGRRANIDELIDDPIDAIANELASDIRELDSGFCQGWELRIERPAPAA